MPKFTITIEYDIGDKFTLKPLAELKKVTELVHDGYICTDFGVFKPLFFDPGGHFWRLGYLGLGYAAADDDEKQGKEKTLFHK